MVRNTGTFDAQSEPLIRTFQEENEEQTRMVVHKDPLEGIDISGMTPLEIRKLTLQKDATTRRTLCKAKKSGGNETESYEGYEKRTFSRWSNESEKLHTTIQKRRRWKCTQCE